MPTPSKRKQEEEQALPTAPFSYHQLTKAAPKMDDKPIDARKSEETAIASLKHHPPYAHLEKHIRQQAENLKKMLDVPLDSMSDEEIGKRYVVANFGAEQLLGIINYVDQLAAAIGQTRVPSEGEADSSPSS